MLTKSFLHQLSYRIIGCAIEVHRQLGPGLLESVYEVCLIEELQLQGLNVQSQVCVPVVYKGKKLNKELKIDLLIENAIVVELKAVEAMIPLYRAQLLSHLKLAGLAKGFLINFNSVAIKDDLDSMVTEKYAALPD